MLRGNCGQSIFLTDDDRDAFEALVAEGVSRFGHRIHGKRGQALAIVLFA